MLDPACGSGNFFTKSYQCLRRLDNHVLIELSKDGQISFDIEGTGEDQVKVTLANFHDIEINDFAYAVARTALWIAEKQADADTASIVHHVYQTLPLTDYGNIRQGNALRLMGFQDSDRLSSSTWARTRYQTSGALGGIGEADPHEPHETQVPPEGRARDANTPDAGARGEGQAVHLRPWSRTRGECRLPQGRLTK
ncbi:DNA methyltransferase [Olsenella porci]|uniref:site-specific DNA-methyltransferase (adenine-specific) n=1 Tax=Olsenella porci TaxID=2652279 RepID=A0A6N7XU26_9ACTN|nr:DNA methyltransferase [Olsenella porci]MST73389.1 hypothetical protein [Olsenella porci]